MKKELAKPCQRPISSRCSSTTTKTTITTTTITTRTTRRKSTTCHTIFWTVIIMFLSSVSRSSRATCTKSSGGIVDFPAVAAAWIATPIPTTTRKVKPNDLQRRQRWRVESTNWSSSGRLFLSPPNNVPDSAGTTTADSQQPGVFGDTNTASSTSNISIRYCEYSDLGTVADIIMDSFYAPKTSWRGLYRVAELNRVQQNFPYVDTESHQMLVVVATETDTKGVLQPKIIGFCDVDCRPCQTMPRLPRPYLSDLSVALDFRRRGIARSLVKRCEAFVRDCTTATKELYIRVEATNEPAVSMYRGMGYQTIRQETQRLDYKNGAEVTLLVLQKKLNVEDDKAEPVSQTVVLDNDNVDPGTLDFVV